VADQFIVDRFGKYSIVGIWDAISAPNFPAIHPQLFIVSGWTGDALAMIMAETRLWTPAGTLLLTTGLHPFRLSPSGKGINANQIVQTQFAQPGNYRVELIGDGEVKHQFEIGLVQQQPTPSVQN
jgi:hypothetical protein